MLNSRTPLSLWLIGVEGKMDFLCHFTFLLHRNKWIRLINLQACVSLRLSKTTKTYFLLASYPFITPNQLLYFPSLSLMSTHLRFVYVPSLLPTPISLDVPFCSLSIHICIRHCKGEVCDWTLRSWLMAADLSLCVNICTKGL